jgi:hypothetical protein
MTLSNSSTGTAQIGVTGLAVMGSNIAPACLRRDQPAGSVPRPAHAGRLRPVPSPPALPWARRARHPSMSCRLTRRPSPRWPRPTASRSWGHPQLRNAFRRRTRAEAVAPVDRLLPTTPIAGSWAETAPSPRPCAPACPPRRPHRAVIADKAAFFRDRAGERDGCSSMSSSWSRTAAGNTPTSPTLMIILPAGVRLGLGPGVRQSLTRLSLIPLSRLPFRSAPLTRCSRADSACNLSFSIAPQPLSRSLRIIATARPPAETYLATVEGTSLPSTQRSHRRRRLQP